MPPEEPDQEGAPEADEPRAPLPDPLDRVWIHPTELSSFVAAPAPPPNEARRRDWTIAGTSAVVAVAATVLVLVAFGAIGGRNPRPVLSSPPTGTPDTVDYTIATKVAALAGPSVVAVHVVKGDTSVSVSGVALMPDRVLTGAHALAGATALAVLTSDGKSLAATLLGIDPDTDLALLKIDGGRLRAAHLGSPDDMTVGQTVVAVAAENGGQRWVSLGVIAALNAMVGAPGAAIVAGLIESDAKTKPESAGGALLDTGGAVVGILADPPGASGGGLAVPIDVAQNVADQLATSGKADHGWLGIVGADVEDRPAGGVKVGSVVSAGPAAKAGVAPNDLITAAGDHAIHGLGDLLAEVRRHVTGDSLTLTVLRDGHRRSLKATLGSSTTALASGVSGG